MNFHHLLPGFTRRAFAALFALLAIPALAQYPTKPIRLVVPFPAGGTADMIARAIATPMAQTLGQPILIDNKPGADGLIAADLVAKAAPDGYTLLLGGSSLSFLPAVRKSLPFDPIADFTPVGMAGEFGYFIYVNPSVPVRDLREFVAYIRANPGTVNHGHVGASSQIMATAFGQVQKLNFVQVPYKGEAQLAPDLLSNRVQFSLAPGNMVSRVKDGKLRALATTLPARSPLLPDVPTFVEAGLPAPPTVPWTGFLGPARMPPEVVDRLSRALHASLALPEVRERFTGIAGQVRLNTPEQFASMLKEQAIAWRRQVEAAGIQPE